MKRIHAGLVGLALLAGCNNDAVMAATERAYNQIQRLGNPLVSEVFLAKRSHPVHGATGPAQDVTLISAELKAFVANVAGRNATVQNTLAAVLLPDELIIQTDKDPASAGWLSWALANGWGGRKLGDDVVDAGLSAIFGSLLDPSNTSPGLTTDNVAANDVAFGATFPYLAALYLQRAREMGDFEDYRRAEALARRSLALRVAHNAGTYTSLASALLAQHRFAEALRVARDLNARDPGVPGHQALLAEIELELGRYDAARALVDSLWPARHELSVAPRLARRAEISGRTDLARRLLDAALARAKARPDLPPEQLAWFYLRVGGLALRHDRLAEAEHAFRTGPSAFPSDYRLLAAQARLAAARGGRRAAVAHRGAATPPGAGPAD